VDELPEESLELLESPDEPLEPLEPLELLEPLEPLELLEPLDEPPEVAPPDDVPVPADVPVDFTAASVEPGRTASTAPATATLARDTVTVVVLRRRLPRSRSATARSSSLLFMPSVCHARLQDPFGEVLSML
jgi:hypothetical protein